MRDTIRIGAGSAFESDHHDAAQVSAEKGDLDYIVFDCLAEKTLSEAYARRDNGQAAFDLWLVSKLRAVLPGCVKNGTRIIMNGGILDPKGAAQAAADLCNELGFRGLKIAYVEGGDVTDLVRQLNPKLIDADKQVSDLGNEFLGAQAYGGAREIVNALADGADIVITSRAGDSEQYLAPMIHEFGWKWDDWQKIGAGLGLGHLLECAGQVTGGFFSDGTSKIADGLDELGFPIAEVSADGSAVITKVEGTGGVVSVQTCREQMVYEIGDPSRYLHADGAVDFTTTSFEQVGPDRVRVSGTGGHPKPQTAKIAIATREGFVGLGRIMYGGTGAVAKAKIAADIVLKRLQKLHKLDTSEVRVDYVGLNALFDWKVDPDSLKEVELRICGQFPTREEASKIAYEVSLLPCNGPAGAAWGRPLDQGGVEEIIGYHSALIPEQNIRYQLDSINV